MRTTVSRLLSLACLLLAISPVSRVYAQEQIKTTDGTLAGVYNPATDVRSFKGVPFAAPPVGALRWQPPTPVKPWEDVRPADKFGPRVMQKPIFSDMVFRSDGMSEDCLYLNVWTPGKTNGSAPLPVMVYFYGGGFQGGDGSEHRYDGENMSAHGMVAVTVNYRLGVLGFLAHPALTAESPRHASGNYGLLDQHAALEWVQRNVAAFGGDPKRVTVAGESAGSFSVSAQMASPLSKDLMAQAIGESGSLVAGQHPATSLAEGEAKGAKFAAGLGLGDAPTLAALRDLPADRLVAAVPEKGEPRFAPVVDGYFFPKSPTQIYEAGEQAHVPLLAGVNSEEQGFGTLLEKATPTVENYQQAVRRLYPNDADDILKLYPATDEAETKDAARDLAGDRFIRHGTWRWMDLSTKTGGQPTYYYLYTHPRPPMKEGKRPAPRGAVHAAEIEYALGNLDGNQVYAWTPEDREVSRQMQAYFVNFIKTGQPNGEGLTEWPKFASGQHLVIDLHPHPESNDPLRARYALLDRIAASGGDTPPSHPQAATPVTTPPASPSGTGYATIHNDFFCLDQNGARINTRSGCLRQFNGTFYWYGGTARFHDQTCYSSPDLIHWTYKGVVLHLDVDANRMEVLYNEATKQYVMFMKYDGNGAFLAIATSPKPEGPFTFQSKTLVDNARMGDMSVYQDTDGKAYLCYVSWATGTNAQHGLYLMSPDYLTLDKRMFLWDIPHREAPHLFKRNGIYYYGTSKTAGIQSSGTSYYTATNLAGPWSEAKPLRTPGSNNSWDSQVDFIYPFQGTQGTVYMFAGDRWLKNQGRQGDYVWLPLEFDGDEPILNYQQDWDLNVSTGTWRKFDAARNLAAGKPATASSVNGDHAANSVTTPTTYENYVDTRWESEANDPQWITVDLGAPTAINRVILKWGTTCAKAFKIQISPDAKAWTDVYDATQGAPSSVTDQSFKTAAARYVRMYGTQRETRLPYARRSGDGAGRGTPQPEVPPPTQNGYTLFGFQVLAD